MDIVKKIIFKEILKQGSKKSKKEKGNSKVKYIIHFINLKMKKTLKIGILNRVQMVHKLGYTFSQYVIRSKYKICIKTKK